MNALHQALFDSIDSVVLLTPSKNLFKIFDMWLMRFSKDVFQRLWKGSTLDFAFRGSGLLLDRFGLNNGVIPNHTYVKMRTPHAFQANLINICLVIDIN